MQTMNIPNSVLIPHSRICYPKKTNHGTLNHIDLISLEWQGPLKITALTGAGLSI